MWRSISEMARSLILVIRFSSENDAERAVRTALAVIAAVAELTPRTQRLSVRVGIATGSVLVGNIIGPDTNPERGARQLKNGAFP
jgi:class 3 adenylate cyclase